MIVLLCLGYSTNQNCTRLSRISILATCSAHHNLLNSAFLALHSEPAGELSDCMCSKYWLSANYSFIWNLTRVHTRRHARWARLKTCRKINIFERIQFRRNYFDPVQPSYSKEEQWFADLAENSQDKAKNNWNDMDASWRNASVLCYSFWGCFRTKCRGSYQESSESNCGNWAIEKIR